MTDKSDRIGGGTQLSSAVKEIRAAANVIIYAMTGSSVDELRTVGERPVSQFTHVTDLLDQDDAPHLIGAAHRIFHLTKIVDGSASHEESGKAKLGFGSGNVEQEMREGSPHETFREMDRQYKILEGSCKRCRRQVRQVLGDEDLSPRDKKQLRAYAAALNEAKEGVEGVGAGLELASQVARFRRRDIPKD